LARRKIVSSQLPVASCLETPAAATTDNWPLATDKHNEPVRYLFTWLTFALMLPAAAAAAELKGDERVTLFPALGHRAGDGWQIEMQGCVWEPEFRPVLGPVLRRALDIDADELGPTEQAIFKERTMLFLVDRERGKRVSVRIGEVVVKLPPSGPNGHFTDRVRLDQADVLDGGPGTKVLQVFLPPTPGASAEAPAGEIHLLEPTGLSIISDIDDTIKVSQVTDRRELLRNTFCRPFRPVPGMAELYRRWAERAEAQFHYVSASPWQLYGPLAEFVRSNGFPRGTFHLKPFRVKDETFLQLFASPEKYKRGVIEPLLRRFPQRRFVLVGDSGEKDPEIYGELARKHPGQVHRILIRDVTAESADSPRYQTAFRDLPRSVWQVFQEPREVWESVEALKH
jgi:hypothetical protein